MVVAYRKSSFDIFKKGYTVAKCLAISPFFDPNDQGIYCKMYAFSHIMIIAALQMYSFIEHFESKKNTNSSFLIQASREIISFSQYLLTILGAAFWNRKRWAEFYYRFSQTGSYLHESRGTFYMRNFNAISAITGLSFLCGSCISLATMEMDAIIEYLRHGLVYYYMFCGNVTMSLMFAYTCSIFTKFTSLRVVLKRRYTQKTDCSLTLIGNIYRQLCDFTELYNSLFGIQILASMVQSCILSLELLNVIWLYVSGQALAENILYRDLVLSGILCLLTLAGPVMVIFGCDWVTREATKIPKVCYKYQENFETFSREKQELLDLAYQLNNNKPDFSACGFFEMNRTTVFAVFGTAFTYFIIMIQLNFS